jgi:hypothetical protein
MKKQLSVWSKLSVRKYCGCSQKSSQSDDVPTNARCKRRPAGQSWSMLVYFGVALGCILTLDSLGTEVAASETWPVLRGF